MSRFYVINFLGQSEVPYDRLKRRLLHNPHVTLEVLERQQLVRQSGGKVKVVPETQRADYLLERLACARQTSPNSVCRRWKSRQPTI